MFFFWVLWHSLCPLLQTSTPDLTPVLMPYSTHLDQNHFLMMEIVAWNIPLSNGKTENSLLGVWFWGSVSHFRSRPFVTGSYIIHSHRAVITFKKNALYCFLFFSVRLVKEISELSDFLLRSDAKLWMCLNKQQIIK